LHRDNYENIYSQITGSKDFILLPPIATACINEQFLPSATYDSAMNIVPDELPAPVPCVPCAVWNPDKPDENTTEFSRLAKPIHVRLDPGDVLYLPALWYHKVSQSNSEEGLCCSVNYCRSTDRLLAISRGLIHRQGTTWTLKAGSILLMHSFVTWPGLLQEQGNFDHLRPRPETVILSMI